MKRSDDYLEGYRAGWRDAQNEPPSIPPASPKHDEGEDSDTIIVDEEFLKENSQFEDFGIEVGTLLKKIRNQNGEVIGYG